jgi:hypothetical protein
MKDATSRAAMSCERPLEGIKIIEHESVGLII